MSDLLELRYVPLSTVRRWDRNPKQHDMGALAAAIERYGFTDPPKYDPALNNGEGGLAHGNGRDECLEWLKGQGRKAPRGIGVQDDEWLIPVLFGVDASSQSVAEAYAIDHNNLTMAGGNYTALDMSRMWDTTYTDILANLADMGELPVTLDADDLALLLDITPEAGGGGDDFDSTPQDGPTRTALGELWVIGGVHRLVVGDCTDASTVSLLMGGERADMGFTDTPYNVDYQANESIESLKARNRRTDGKIVGNDNTPDVAINGVAQMFSVLLPGAPMYICFPAEQPSTLAQMWGEGTHLQSMIVWVKDRIVMGRKDHHYQHEPIWYGWKEGAAHTWVGGHTESTVWEIDRPFDSEDHPTEKPIALPQKAIENSSKPNALVIDFFAGSGVTLTAAHRTGRRAYLCELLPMYADVILRRAEAEGLECVRVDG